MKKQIFTKNRTPLLISFVLLSILTINLVSAFGVSSPVWRGNPLGVSPGKTGTAELTLQNMVGTEDVTVRVILKEGKEIAIVEEKDSEKIKFEMSRSTQTGVAGVEKKK